MEDSGRTTSVSSEARVLEACRAGQFGEMQSLLDELKLFDPELCPSPEKMMIAAAQYDQSAIVKFWLDQGSPITGFLIQKVAICDAFETYKLLVFAGIDIDYAIEWFGDFLLMAVGRESLEEVRFCLEHGADPNRHMVEDSKTAIAHAAELGLIEIAGLLLSHGARVIGSGAIVVAAEAGHLAMVRLLLDFGAEIDEIGLKDYGDNRADEDMGSALHKAVTKRHLDVLHLLIDRGANVELHDFLNRTPMERAWELSYEAGVNALESRGATK